MAPVSSPVKESYADRPASQEPTPTEGDHRDIIHSNASSSTPFITRPNATTQTTACARPSHYRHTPTDKDTKTRTNSRTHTHTQIHTQTHTIKKDVHQLEPELRTSTSTGLVLKGVQKFAKEVPAY